MNERFPSVLVVCGYPPNAIDGGGILLRGLLSALPADRLAVVTSAYMLRWLKARPRDPQLLQGTYLPIDSPLSGHPAARVALGVLNPLKLPSLTRTVADAARQSDVILTLPWGNSLGSEIFVAAHLAHRRTGTPLVVYELDDWRASLCLSSGPAAPVLERRYHRSILEAAHTVWAVSKPMAINLRERFGVTARVMPHSVDIPAEQPAPRGASDDDALRVLFTGSVSGPQAGAIAGILRAIETGQRTDDELVIYTNQSRAELGRHGIAGARLRIEEPVPVDQIPRVLATGDVLLLPFSFDARQRSIVSTSFPTKTADYLASGVPILVHAPDYASITRAADDGGWAEVITDPDPAVVMQGLDRLRSDEGRRATLVAHALEYARARHDRAARSREFVASLAQAASSRHTPPKDV